MIENVASIYTFKRSFSKLVDLDSSDLGDVQEALIRNKRHHSYAWTISDALSAHKITKPSVKLPLKSFNHVAREVISIEESRRFYCDILGFEEVERPPFECKGCWLSGYGLSLHLVASTVPDVRKRLKLSRIEHFSTCLPVTDHIAFMTDSIDYIKEILDKECVYYKLDSPTEGISQLFFFDPDGNVIEVSNCDESLKNKCPLDLDYQSTRLLESKDYYGLKKSCNNLSHLDNPAKTSDDVVIEINLQLPLPSYYSETHREDDE